MTAVFRNIGPVIEVDDATIDMLIEASGTEPKRRARLNLHNSDDDLLHEMIIAFRKDSLNMPHRHVGKSESMHVIRGRVEVIIFDDVGNVTRRVKLRAFDQPRHWGRDSAPLDLAHVFRMAAPLWHTVIPVDDVVVVHETTNGPFVAGKNMEIPPWAPQESELAAWVDGLRCV
jgi:cupin fold WbuC family metalloprotein